MSTTVNDLEIITFSELKRLNDEDLALCVSKDAAIKICRISIEHNSIDCTEAATNEIFHLWVHKLNKIFEVEHCSTDEWKYLTEFFIQIVQQHTVSETTDNTVLQAEILNILYDALVLLEWFHQLHSQLGLKKCCITLQFVLQTVSLSLAYYRKDPTSCERQEILQQTLLLYNFALQVLSENVDVCKINDSEEVTRLFEVQETLCMLIEDAASISLKTIIETWKCVTKLTLHCAKFSFTMDNESNPNSVSIMASRPINFLLLEIRRSLNIIYKEETLRQPIEQIEKYLRITNFYLKLLQRLADTLRHEHFPCITEFLETFLISKSPPKYMANSELIVIVEKYVLQDLGEVFNMIYKNQKIIEMLLNKSSHNKLTEFNIMAKEFVRATLLDKKETFINDKIDSYINIYQSLTKDVQTFCASEAYKEIVELFAALAILNNTGKFKKYLRYAILREDFMLAYTSMDVLLTIASSCHSSSDELLQNFRYWRQCNKNFSLFTNNPRELQVCLLLLHYYNLCQAKALFNKTELFIEEFEDTEVLSSAHRLFIALPVVSEAAENKLSRVFEKGEVPHSVHNYYKMLLKVKYLTSNDVPRELNVTDDMQSSILNVTLNILNSPALDVRPFSRLLVIVLEFSTKYFQQMDEAAVLSLLKIFRQHVAKLDDYVFPSLYAFINTAQTRSEKLERITAELLFELCTKPNAKLLQKIFIFKKFKNTENCKMNSDLYSQFILKPFVKHNCKLNINCQSPSSKRLRIEEDGALKFVLNDMLEKSQQLLSLNAKLETHDLLLLNNIKNNLNNLLSNQAATNKS